MFSGVCSATQRGCNYGTGGGKALTAAFPSLSPLSPSTARREAPAGAAPARGAAPSARAPSHPAALAAQHGSDGGRGRGGSGRRRRLPVLRPAAAAHHLRAPAGLAAGPGPGSALPEPLQGAGRLRRAGLRLHPEEAVGAGRPGSRGRGCGPGSGLPALRQRSPPARGRARAGGARGGPVWALREEGGRRARRVPAEAPEPFTLRGAGETERRWSPASYLVP